MEDLMRKQKGFLPELGSLYDSNEDADIDERYRRDEPLVIGEAKETRSVDSYSYLSEELNSEMYQIRTPEQQAKWTETKTNNTRMIGKYLMRTNYALNKLLEICESEKPPEKLLGVFDKDEKEDRIFLNNENCHDHCIVAAALIREYLSGSGRYTLEEISNIIVDDYNLSYPGFSRDICVELIKEYREIKKLRKAHLESMPEGSSLSLSFIEDDESNSRSLVRIREFEEKIGRDWTTTASIMRNLGVLYTSSEGCKERLVSTNMRSCLSAAMNHYHAVGGSKNVNFEVEDLVTEAAIGLMHAADMYVHGTSARFTTYAEYWIRLKVTRYTKDNNVVRIPVHVTDMMYTVIKYLRSVDKNGLSETPSREEVEAAIGKKISESVWQVALNRYKGMAIAVSCVTTDNDEETVSFDIFSGSHDESEEQAMSFDASKILYVAKSLVRDDVTSKHKEFITPEQYKFLLMAYVDGMKNPEIAEMWAGEKGAVNSEGKRVDSKYVRTELARAIERIQKKMGVSL